MAIGLEVYSEIRSLYEREGLSQRGIARRLNISRNTVKKYFEGTNVPWERLGVSGRHANVITDQVARFIQDCIDEDTNEGLKKQKHTARRIYQRLRSERGFTGGESTVREYVSKLRNEPKKVYIPLAYDPAEAMQVDRGEATIYLKGKKVIVNIWCMRECYSVDSYCKAFYRQNEESFLDGLVSGFEHFNGAPKRIIFDNAKVAVKEGFGRHAKIQEKYAALSAHYAFKAEFCNVGEGHEKGLVEGLVGWSRRNFLVPIPHVDSIEEMNDILERGCIEYRNHTINGKEQTVGKMAMLSTLNYTRLPKHKYDCAKTITARVDEYSMVRFDTNKYSVPMEYVGKEVAVKAYGNNLKVLSNCKEIAVYTRCYGRKQTMYCLEHYLDLIERRPRSVYNAKPVRENISAELMEIGRRLSSLNEMIKLLRLFLEYGESDLMGAIHAIKSPEITIEQIKGNLIATSVKSTAIDHEIKVAIPSLSTYDSLIEGRIA